MVVLSTVLLSACAPGESQPEPTINAAGSSTPGDQATTDPTSDTQGSSNGSTAAQPAPSGSASPLPDDWRPEEPTVLATGQKVPDDYEPATLDHPARNVPKPVMPEEAKHETEAGAQAFLNYRADAQWYSIQTGDTSLIRDVTSPDCGKCTEQYDSFDEMYREGNWAAGGFEKETIKSRAFIKRSDNGYNLPVEVDSRGMVEIEDNKIKLQQAPFNLSDRFDTYLYFENGSWVYLTASPRGSL